MDLRLLPVDKVQIYLLFYKPTPTDPWLNRLVAFADGPFSHVEMAIPDRYGEEPWERIIWGSSIYQGEPVFFKQKTYKRDGYVSIAIEVTVQQAHRIRAFCRAHAERETPFSPLAMYAAYLPVQIVHTNHTFCSKHVAEALQSADVPVFRGINPALTTPSRLYRQISRQAILQVPLRGVKERTSALMFQLPFWVIRSSRARWRRSCSSSRRRWRRSNNKHNRHRRSRSRRR